VTSAVGFDPCSEITSVHQKLSSPQITITDPGYIYIFVSNESEDTRVWFDDLNITHQRSNIVAGADYYPFGLPMGNREITREDYRHGYQGQYSEKDRETGWNAFELRMYDARVARWMSADPKGQFFSPYVGMGNNPVIGVDPDGGFTGGTLLGEVLVTASRLPSLAESFASAAFRSVASSAIASAFSPPHDYIEQLDGTFKLARKTNDDFNRVYRRDGRVDNYTKNGELINSHLEEMTFTSRQNQGDPLWFGKMGASLITTTFLSFTGFAELSYGSRLYNATRAISFASKADGAIANLARVRHHTSPSGLSGIRSSGSINASRGVPLGVDVEVAPFLAPSKVNLGQAGRGAYVEFSIHSSQIIPKPNIGIGNAGRIATGGSPLNIQNANPSFVRSWWPF
jgi:RHS repeat-associated protein